MNEVIKIPKSGRHDVNLALETFMPLHWNRPYQIRKNLSVHRDRYLTTSLVQFILNVSKCLRYWSRQIARTVPHPSYGCRT
jgi:hypothetical protein